MVPDETVTIDLEWEALDGSPLPTDVGIVDRGLDEFNQASADLSASRQFACLARNTAGDVIGGAIARYWGRCCELQQLWIDDAFRRRGLGRRLMLQVEQLAGARGCDTVYLDTFSFQAPVFYLKLGYDVACELEGFPNDVSKFILRKSLCQSAPAAS